METMFNEILSRKINLSLEALVEKLGQEKFHKIQTGKFPKRLTVKSLVKFVKANELFSVEVVSRMFPESNGTMLVCMAQMEY